MRKYSFGRLAISGLLAGALAVGGLTYSLFYNKTSKTPVRLEESVALANSQLRAFPTTNIPGIREVEKWEKPGATYVLAHIKQVHKPAVNIKEYQSGRVAKYHEELIKRVQEDIYHSLLFFGENNNIRHVYEEGLTSSVLEKIGKDKKAFFSFREAFRNNARSDRYQTNSSVQGFVSYLDKKATRGLSATRRVFFDGKMDLRETTSEATNEEVAKVTERFEDTKRNVFSSNRNNSSNAVRAIWIDFLKQRKLVYGTREAEVLSNIHKDFQSGRNDKGNRLAVVVFGGIHDFRDKIINWNFNNPDKFSLIELTPNSYADPRSPLFFGKK